MQEDKKKKGKFILGAITAVLAIIALGYILISLGNDQNNTPSLNKKIHYGTSQIQNDEGGVIVDTAHTELLFLDSKSRISEIVSVPLFSSNAKRFECVSLDDRDVYVDEVTYFDSSTLIESEKIIKYNLDGEKLGTLFEIDYDQEANSCCTPTICMIAVRDGVGIGLSRGINGNNPTMFKFQTDVPDSPASLEENAISLPCLPNNDYIFLADCTSDCSELIIQTVLNEYYTADVDTALEGTNDTSLYRMTKKNQSDAGSQEIPVTISLDENGRVETETQIPFNEETLEFTDGLFIRTLLFWICTVYVILLFLVAVVMFIAGAIQRKDSELLKHIAYIVIATVFCLVIVGFYSVCLMGVEYNNIENSIKSNAVMVSDCSGSVLTEGIESFNDDGIIDETVYEELHSLFSNSIMDIAKAGNGVGLSLVTEDKFGAVCQMVDVITSSPAGGYDSSYQAVYDGMVEAGTVSCSPVNSESGLRLVAIAPVFSADGKIIGGVCATQDMVVFIIEIFQICLNLLITLLSAMILFGFAIMEGRDWVRAFSYRRKLVMENNAHPEFAMARPMMFLTILATSVDSTLLPIIAKEISADTFFSDSSFLLALPVSAFSLGFVASTPVYTYLVRHFPLRRVMVGASLAGIVFYIACAFSVTSSNFVLLTISVFFVNTALNIPCSYAITLPMLADSSDRRSEINRSMSMAKISGSAISIMIAGLMANQFGNAAVYVFGVLTTIAVLVFFGKTVPKGMLMAEEDVVKAEHKTAGSEAKEDAHEVRRFLLDPPILALVVCMMVPMTMAAAYKSYLFPLFATAEGMDKATISNIVVFCSAFVFFSGNLISRAERSIGTTPLLAYSGVILSLTFLMFFSNTSLAWAVIALVITQVMCKTMQPAVSSFWQNRLIESGRNKVIGQSVIYIADKLLETLRSPVLGALLQSFGNMLTCAIVGIYGAVTAFIFALISGIIKRKSDKLQKKQ